ncbi:PRC-barrel domain-containing protein [Xanthobacter sp. AM11]|uniref:PRC-barrel domain-containing protein n=1 Tax=Xanthobacter sp. AM11 TaxID=3380643 RepID=UPI0039BF15E0
MPIYAVTLATLLSTTAMAQQPPATPGAQMTPPAGSTAAPATFIGEQRADQFLAADLIGMSVHGANNETLGEINDLLVDANGNVMAAVIGVGGFLGVGEKDVAVPFQLVEKVRNADGMRLVLRKSKDELKAAPTFAEYEAAPATTGSVGSGARPATPPATAR